MAFLGYRDSGMDGEPTTKDPECFAMADLEEAATRLAAILREEDAEVLTVYDERGNYGHPDHIQVHRVGIRAAEMAGTPRVVRVHDEPRLHRRPDDRHAPRRWRDIEDAPDPEEMDLGMPAAMITTTVDVRDYVGQKRAAMVAHASQIPADSFFLQLPPDAFAAAFGQEWFIRRGPERAAVEDTLVPVD